MTDSLLEDNVFYRYLQNELTYSLASWTDPKWIVCIPTNKSCEGVKFSSEFAASQALYKHDSQRLQYASELFGSSITYEVTGDESRAVVWNVVKANEVYVSKAIVLNEYLITVKDQIVHVLLIDRRLPSMIEEDDSFLTKINSINISSNREAEEFLGGFCCHTPLLEKLNSECERVRTGIQALSDVDEIQCCLHSLILMSWEALIKRHTIELQTNAEFQDFLFRALDFYIVGMCHEVLWSQVLDRCRTVDQMVRARVCYLRSWDVCPSQLGLPEDFDTPLPAAVVELATLNARGSALEKLHCIRDALELIQAQAKETKANLYQFQDSDPSPEGLQITEMELVTLLVTVLIQAQCVHVVANIYYMTHYIFSVPNELHPLWHSLFLLRKSLEKMMKMDVSCLPPVAHSLKKELSLQDLMQVSSEVELTFESRHARAGSQSASDITALDLQLQQLTHKIQMSTQALSETQLDESDSPSRRLEREIPQHFLPQQSQSRMQSFVEFLSSIPSTIRASFRRKQSEQKTAIYSTMER